MGLGPVRACLLAACAWALAGTLANGQEAVAEGAAHVRGAHVEETLLLDELVARSLIARELVDRLERSDLTIYIVYKLFSSPTLRGRIGFPGMASHVRLLVIELDSGAYLRAHRARAAARRGNCRCSAGVGCPVARRALRIDRLDDRLRGGHRNVETDAAPRPAAASGASSPTRRRRSTPASATRRFRERNLASLPGAGHRWNRPASTCLRGSFGNPARSR
jgi:hypothetical protein